MNDLIYDKRDILLNELHPYTDLLIFPKDLVDHLKQNNLDLLSNNMYYYSNYLVKIKNLEEQLENLINFGILCNSYLAWKFTIERNIQYLLKYRENILLNLEVLSISDKILFNKYKINKSFITTYLLIKEVDNRYSININNNYNVLTKDEVRLLLPRYL